MFSAYTLISVVNIVMIISTSEFLHLKKHQKGETYCFYQNKRPPGFFWSSVRPTGRCPNRSFERFSIGIHIGPVRGPLGWSPGAERPEAHLQITSFTRVEGRITHSSLPSVQDPATWVSYRRERRYGAGPRGWGGVCQTWLTKPY